MFCTSMKNFLRMERLELLDTPGSVNKLSSSSDFMIKSFRITGIFTAMNGTEEDWIYGRADDPSSGDKPSPSSDTDKGI